MMMMMILPLVDGPCFDKLKPTRFQGFGIFETVYDGDRHADVVLWLLCDVRCTALYGDIWQYCSLGCEADCGICIDGRLTTSDTKF